MSVSDLAELAHPVLAAPASAADIPPAAAMPVHAVAETAVAQPVSPAAAAPVPAPMPAAAPASAADDLARQFEDHAERARRQETIRGWATWAILAMLAAFAAIIVDPRSGSLLPAIASACVCVLSVAGGLVNEMHRAEFDRHRQAMRACKSALLALGAPNPAAARWQQVDREPVFADGYMSFYPIWRPVFIATFALGLLSLFTSGAPT